MKPFTDQAIRQNFFRLRQDRRHLRTNYLELYYKYDPKNIDFPAALKDASKHNDIPSDFAAQLARDIREKLEENLLKQELKLLQIDQLSILQREKNSIIRTISPTWHKIQVCNTILSVFRHVPAEILQEIACYARPPQPSFDSGQAPLLLAHVCRLWRRAVFDMPTLWKHLYLEVDLRKRPGWPMEIYTQMVQSWFQRTGSHALSFHIYTPSGSSDIENNRESFVKHFLAPLRPIFLRVRNLSIGAPWVADLLPLFAGKIPAYLRTLVIMNKDQLSQHYLPAEPTGSPALKDIEQLVIDASCINSGLRHVLQWSKLTTMLVGQTLTIRQYVNVLDACSSLITGFFTLTDTSPPSIPPKPSDPTSSHRKIQHLSLLICDKQLALATVLLNYQYSNMVTFELGHSAEVVDDPVDNEEDTTLSDRKSLGFLPFIHRISLTGGWFGSYHTFVSMLHPNPFLEDLYLSIRIPPWAIFRCLTMREYQPRRHIEDTTKSADSLPFDITALAKGFLPRLSTLKIAISPVHELHEAIPTLVETLTEMLTARASASVLPQQRLKVLQISARDAKVVAGMQHAADPFVRLGLRFEICSDDVRPDWCLEYADSGLGWWQAGIDKRLAKRMKKGVKHGARAHNV